MTNEASRWTRSICPICGHSFPHKPEYKPVTCGKFNCLQVAYLRGMLDSRSEDAGIADNMRDYCRHLGHAD